MSPHIDLVQKCIVQNGRIMFKCASCGFAPPSPIRTNGKKLLKVNCKCGVITAIRVMKPRFRRKPTRIPGDFDGIPVVILDISEKGYKIQSSSALSARGTLSFELPDNHSTQVIEIVSVVRKNGREYGLVAEITPYSTAQKAKGFWLMP